ncbi:hypothetical protein FNF31_05470 [Cafeteria roenbergensis]|uniref:Uncharacterized protein n=1 Tax=Cafeteria roenbergensis TaxID=33653 RepID=A0A5A8CYX2_CAFRO|nr:hypothetical protein FNF31_05470 [Cafeteria roenbergensis]
MLVGVEDITLDSGSSTTLHSSGGSRIDNSSSVQSLAAAELNMQGAATMTALGPRTTQLQLIARDRMVLAPGASIRAQGVGYGSNARHPSCSDGGARNGGMHGGGPEGKTCGDYEWPVLAGAGGSSGQHDGGSGGGSVMLVCNATESSAMELNGTVSVDGQSGRAFTSGSGSASGGGAGGSLLVVASRLSGSGTLSADGGAGADGYETDDSNGGSGGRIAIHAYQPSRANFTGTVRARAGPAYGSWSPQAAAGTVYWCDGRVSESEAALEGEANAHRCGVRRLELDNGDLPETPYYPQLSIAGGRRRFVIDELHLETATNLSVQAPPDFNPVATPASRTSIVVGEFSGPAGSWSAQAAAGTTLWCDGRAAPGSESESNPHGCGTRRLEIDNGDLPATPYFAQLNAVRPRARFVIDHLYLGSPTNFSVRAPSAFHPETMPDDRSSIVLGNVSGPGVSASSFAVAAGTDWTVGPAQSSAADPFALGLRSLTVAEHGRLMLAWAVWLRATTGRYGFESLRLLGDASLTLDAGVRSVGAAQVDVLATSRVTALGPRSTQLRLVARDGLRLAPGAAIRADGIGFAGGERDASCSAGDDAGEGGMHGGGPAGQTCGDYEWPVLAGAGGSGGASGGSGGGSLLIQCNFTASSSVDLAGLVTVDGHAGSGSSGAGGAGGSLVVVAGRLAVTGTLSADGGAASASSNANGGSGGRIALHAYQPAWAAATGSVRTRAGAAQGSWSAQAAAGTTLWCDGRAAPGSESESNLVIDHLYLGSPTNFSVRAPSAFHPETMPDDRSSIVLGNVSGPGVSASSFAVAAGTDWTVGPAQSSAADPFALGLRSLTVAEHGRLMLAWAVWLRATTVTVRGELSGVRHLTLDAGAAVSLGGSGGVWIDNATGTGADGEWAAWACAAGVASCSSAGGARRPQGRYGFESLRLLGDASLTLDAGVRSVGAAQVDVLATSRVTALGPRSTQLRLVARDGLRLAPGAAIRADGIGFAGGERDASCSAGDDAGEGGMHGGGPAGQTCGDYEWPVLAGAGGSGGASGGSGGGSLLIQCNFTASSSVDLAGLVTVDGHAGSGSSGAGGAGGSLVVVAGRLAVTGTLSADGGAASASSNANGGSGGRIALHAYQPAWAAATGSLNAVRPRARFVIDHLYLGSPTNFSVRAPSAFHPETMPDDRSSIVLGNVSGPGVSASSFAVAAGTDWTVGPAQSSAADPFALGLRSLTVAEHGRLMLAWAVWLRATTVTVRGELSGVRHLTLDAGAAVSLGGSGGVWIDNATGTGTGRRLRLVARDGLRLAPGAAIRADGIGFAGGERDASCFEGDDAGEGGMHGGGPAGQTCGDYEWPVLAGAGGSGGASGGSGGGSLLIQCNFTASSSVDLAGLVTVDGHAGSGSSGAGGAGGSLVVVAGRLAVTGTLSADGGAASASSNANGGSGGRIALHAYQPAWAAATGSVRTRAGAAQGSWSAQAAAGTTLWCDGRAAPGSESESESESNPHGCGTRRLEIDNGDLPATPYFAQLNAVRPRARFVIDHLYLGSPTNFSVRAPSAFHPETMPDDRSSIVLGNVSGPGVSASSFAVAAGTDWTVGPAQSSAADPFALGLRSLTVAEHGRLMLAWAVWLRATTVTVRGELSGVRHLTLDAGAAVSLGGSGGVWIDNATGTGTGADGEWAAWACAAGVASCSSAGGARRPQGRYGFESLRLLGDASLTLDAGVRSVGAAQVDVLATSRLNAVRPRARFVIDHLYLGSPTNFSVRAPSAFHPETMPDDRSSIVLGNVSGPGVSASSFAVAAGTDWTGRYGFESLRLLGDASLTLDAGVRSVGAAQVDVLATSRVTALGPRSTQLRLVARDGLRLAPGAAIRADGIGFAGGERDASCFEGDDAGEGGMHGGGPAGQTCGDYEWPVLAGAGGSGGASGGSGGGSLLIQCNFTASSSVDLAGLVTVDGHAGSGSSGAGGAGGSLVVVAGRLAVTGTLSADGGAASASSNANGGSGGRIALHAYQPAWAAATGSVRTRAGAAQGSWSAQAAAGTTLWCDGRAAPGSESESESNPHGCGTRRLEIDNGDLPATPYFAQLNAVRPRARFVIDHLYLGSPTNFSVRAPSAFHPETMPDDRSSIVLGNVSGPGVSASSFAVAAGTDWTVGPAQSSAADPFALGLRSLTVAEHGRLMLAWAVWLRATTVTVRGELSGVRHLTLDAGAAVSLGGSGGVWIDNATGTGADGEWAAWACAAGVASCSSAGGARRLQGRYGFESLRLLGDASLTLDAGVRSVGAAQVDVLATSRVTALGPRSTQLRLVARDGLRLAPGAAIRADGIGFAGGERDASCFEGDDAGEGGMHGGGPAGQTCGDYEWPVLAGAGGSGGASGGSGGGSLLIQCNFTASSSVDLAGLVTVDGHAGSGSSGAGGAGGSLVVVAGRLAVTGTLSADGGAASASSNANGGSGGRIALHAYQPAWAAATGSVRTRAGAAQGSWSAQAAAGTTLWCDGRAAPGSESESESESNPHGCGTRRLEIDNGDLPATPYFAQLNAVRPRARFVIDHLYLGSPTNFSVRAPSAFHPETMPDDRSSIVLGNVSGPGVSASSFAVAAGTDWTVGPAQSSAADPFALGLRSLTVAEHGRLMLAWAVWLRATTGRYGFESLRLLGDASLTLDAGVRSVGAAQVDVLATSRVTALGPRSTQLRLVARDGLRLAPGAAIRADGTGFAGGERDASCFEGDDAGEGGMHGGGPAGQTCGDYEWPVLAGAGGSGGASGGSGGGSLLIQCNFTASSSVDLAGLVTVDGHAGSGSSGAGGAGGAGGSLVVVAGRLAVTGTLSADGGAASASSNANGGSGGRIALHAYQPAWAAATGSVRTRAGAAQGSWSAQAAAGTTLWCDGRAAPGSESESESNPHGCGTRRLEIDNGDLPATPYFAQLNAVRPRARFVIDHLYLGSPTNFSVRAPSAFHPETMPDDRSSIVLGNVSGPGVSASSFAVAAGTDWTVGPAQSSAADPFALGLRSLTVAEHGRLMLAWAVWLRATTGRYGFESLRLLGDASLTLDAGVRSVGAAQVDVLATSRVTALGPRSTQLRLVARDGLRLAPGAAIRADGIGFAGGERDASCFEGDDAGEGGMHGGGPAGQTCGDYEWPVLAGAGGSGGASGGSGGGSLLIQCNFTASSSVDLAGLVTVDGHAGSGSSGAGGAGGSLVVVAGRLAVTGTLSADGGAASASSNANGGSGGRIALHAYQPAWAAATGSVRTRAGAAQGSWSAQAAAGTTLWCDGRAAPGSESESESNPHGCGTRRLEIDNGDLPATPYFAQLNAVRPRARFVIDHLYLGSPTNFSVRAPSAFHPETMPDDRSSIVLGNVSGPGVSASSFAVAAGTDWTVGPAQSSAADPFALGLRSLTVAEHGRLMLAWAVWLRATTGRYGFESLRLLGDASLTLDAGVRSVGAAQVDVLATSRVTALGPRSTQLRLVARDGLRLAPGAAIRADGIGFAGGERDASCFEGDDAGEGGMHGGGPAGQTCGDYEWPVLAGAGGSGGASGGSGGGSLLIQCNFTASSSVDLAGLVTVDGHAGSGSSGAGGAGGSLVVVAGRLAVTGTLSADGGAASASSNANGGSGGRIALHAYQPAWAAATGSVRTRAGAAQGSWSAQAAAGTTLWCDGRAAPGSESESESNPHGCGTRRLEIDNGDLPATPYFAQLNAVRPRARFVIDHLYLGSPTNFSVRAPSAFHPETMPDDRSSIVLGNVSGPGVSASSFAVAAGTDWTVGPAQSSAADPFALGLRSLTVAEHGRLMLAWAVWLRATTVTVRGELSGVRHLTLDAGAAVSLGGSGGVWIDNATGTGTGADGEWAAWACAAGVASCSSAGGARRPQGRYGFESLRLLGDASLTLDAGVRSVGAAQVDVLATSRVTALGPRSTQLRLVARDGLRLAPGAAIRADGIGFAGGERDASCFEGDDAGEGGMHGGGPAGQTCGDYEWPVLAGAGGSGGASGGSGGGSLLIQCNFTASSSVDLAGLVTVDGHAGSGSSGAGGAGGSLVVVAGRLAVTGTLSADGGAASASSNANGGSGGRIALHAYQPAWAAATGSVRTRAGAAQGSWSAQAAAGTTLWCDGRAAPGSESESESNPHGCGTRRLEIDNGDLPATPYFAQLNAVRPRARFVIDHLYLGSPTNFSVRAPSAFHPETMPDDRSSIVLGNVSGPGVSASSFAVAAGTDWTVGPAQSSAADPFALGLRSLTVAEHGRLMLAWAVWLRATTVTVRGELSGVRHLTLDAGAAVSLGGSGGVWIDNATGTGADGEWAAWACAAGVASCSSAGGARRLQGRYGFESLRLLGDASLTLDAGVRSVGAAQVDVLATSRGSWSAQAAAGTTLWCDGRAAPGSESESESNPHGCGTRRLEIDNGDLPATPYFAQLNAVRPRARFVIDHLYLGSPTSFSVRAPSAFHPETMPDDRSSIVLGNVSGPGVSRSRLAVEAGTTWVFAGQPLAEAPVGTARWTSDVALASSGAQTAVSCLEQPFLSLALSVNFNLVIVAEHSQLLLPPSVIMSSGAAMDVRGELSGVRHLTLDAGAAVSLGGSGGVRVQDASTSGVDGEWAAWACAAGVASCSSAGGARRLQGRYGFESLRLLGDASLTLDAGVRSVGAAQVDVLATSRVTALGPRSTQLRLVARDGLRLAPGAAIRADGTGFAGGERDASCSAGDDAGEGGMHGGGPAGQTCGDYEWPVLAGAGGSGGASGGSGGGSLLIQCNFTASSSVDLAGLVTVDGAPGRAAAVAGEVAGGGGAAGSLLVVASRLSGTGVISASGGDAVPAGSGWASNGGSGGRISFLGGTSTFEGTFVSVAGSGPPDQLAAAGTAFTCTGPSCASPSAVAAVPPTRTVLVDARGKLSSGVTEIGGRGLSIELLSRLEILGHATISIKPGGHSPDSELSLLQVEQVSGDGSGSLRLQAGTSVVVTGGAASWSSSNTETHAIVRDSAEVATYSVQRVVTTQAELKGLRIAVDVGAQVVLPPSIAVCNATVEAAGSVIGPRTIKHCDADGDDVGPLPVTGCTNSSAENFNPAATVSNSSMCAFDRIPGCTNQLALNFSPLAEVNDGSCTFSDSFASGCAYDAALNFLPARSTTAPASSQTTSDWSSGSTGSTHPAQYERTTLLLQNQMLLQLLEGAGSGNASCGSVASADLLAAVQGA